MSDQLRRAAAKIRENAEPVAYEPPWRARLYNGDFQVVDGDGDVVAVTQYEDAFHFAVWSPAAALLVAGILEDLADEIEVYPDLAFGMNDYFDLARVILQEDQ